VLHQLQGVRDPGRQQVREPPEQLEAIGSRHLDVGTRQVDVRLGQHRGVEPHHVALAAHDLEVELQGQRELERRHEAREALASDAQGADSAPEDELGAARIVHHPEAGAGRHLPTQGVMDDPVQPGLG